MIIIIFNFHELQGGTPACEERDLVRAHAHRFTFPIPVRPGRQAGRAGKYGKFPKYGKNR